jgi:hypothetical protein
MTQILMELDVEGRCGAGWDEKIPERLNGRNEYRDRTWPARAGSVESRVKALDRCRVSLSREGRLSAELGERVCAFINRL